MRFLYNFLTLPAYLFFLYYKRRNHLIQEDFDAWVNRHIKKSKSKHGAFVELMCRLPEYRTLLYYRMPFAVRHFLNVFLRRTDYKISVGELLGGALIVHGWNTIIVAKKVGKNVMIHHNCTIGWNHDGCPVIGDNVKIYPGAVVAGPISIGNNVTIGANCVVLEDVPDNSLCYGNPCVIRTKG